MPMFCRKALEGPTNWSWNLPRRIPALMLAALGLLALASGAVAQSARLRGMGGASMADIDAGTDFTFTNPAGLSQVDRMEFQAGGTVSDRDLFRADHLAFTGLLYESAEDKKVTLEDYLESDYEFRLEPEKVSNWTYGVSYSTERRSPELNNALGYGMVEDKARSFRFSAATRFPIAERLTSRPELYAGARIRYAERDRRNVSVRTRAKADVWNLDLGAFYKASERLTIGGLARSVISVDQDQTAGAREESASFDLGGGYILGERRDTTVLMDFKNIFNAKRTVPSEIRVGVERRFLDNDFALRVGSWDGVLTLGFGVKFFEDFRMDYSFSNFTEAREHHLSFQLPLTF